MILGISHWPHLYFFGAMVYLFNEKYDHIQTIRRRRTKRQCTPKQRRRQRRKRRISSRQGSLRRSIREDEKGCNEKEVRDGHTVCEEEVQAETGAEEKGYRDSNEQEKKK